MCCCYCCVWFHFYAIHIVHSRTHFVPVLRLFWVNCDLIIFCVYLAFLCLFLAVHVVVGAVLRVFCCCLNWTHIHTVLFHLFDFNVVFCIAHSVCSVGLRVSLEYRFTIWSDEKRGESETKATSMTTWAIRKRATALWSYGKKCFLGFLCEYRQNQQCSR